MLRILISSGSVNMQALQALNHNHLSASHYFSELDREIVNTLRFQALSCRASSRIDIFSVCRSSDLAAYVSLKEYYDLLIRTYPDVIDKQPIWLRVGEVNTTFDESWLVRVISLAMQDQIDNLDMLIRGRVAREKRRFFHLILSNMAKIY